MVTNANDPPAPQWPVPKHIPFQGRTLRLEPLGEEHAAELWRAAQGADDSWIHMRYGPFASQTAMAEQIAALSSRAGQPFWAVRKSSGTAAGWLSLCDVNTTDGAIEIGSIWFSPELQRTRAATEAVFLLMQHALDDLGYNRLVWRCLTTNRTSINAATRYGFAHEGVWRQAAFFKGGFRDLAWHSILKEEWPRRRAVIQAWLADDNFDGLGQARTRLAHPM